MKPNKAIITSFIFFIALSFNWICLAKDFPEAEKKANEHGKVATTSSSPSINQKDLKKFLERLASNEYEGRGTGDKGERMATAYLASFFSELDLEPAGDNGTYFQEFSFNRTYFRTLDLLHRPFDYQESKSIIKNQNRDS